MDLGGQKWTWEVRNGLHFWPPNFISDLPISFLTSQVSNVEFLLTQLHLTLWYGMVYFLMSTRSVCNISDFWECWNPRRSRGFQYSQKSEILHTDLVRGRKYHSLPLHYYYIIIHNYSWHLMGGQKWTWEVRNKGAITFYTTYLLKLSVCKSL